MVTSNRLAPPEPERERARGGRGGKEGRNTASQRGGCAHFNSSRRACARCGVKGSGGGLVVRRATAGSPRFGRSPEVEVEWVTGPREAGVEVRELVRPPWRRRRGSREGIGAPRPGGDHRLVEGKASHGLQRSSAGRLRAPQGFPGREPRSCVGPGRGGGRGRAPGPRAREGNVPPVIGVPKEPQPGPCRSRGPQALPASGTLPALSGAEQARRLQLRGESRAVSAPGRQVPGFARVTHPRYSSAASRII